MRFKQSLGWTRRRRSLFHFIFTCIRIQKKKILEKSSNLRLPLQRGNFNNNTTK